MLSFLAELFVGHPFRIACVGAAFLGAYFFKRGAGASPGSPARAILIAAVLWLLYAAWEGLVLWRSPEADIRVDLLLIWPVLAIASAWGLYRLVRY
jgi:hypothetical protein